MTTTPQLTTADASTRYVIACRRHYYGPTSNVRIYGPYPSRQAAVKAIRDAQDGIYETAHDESGRPDYAVYPYREDYSTHRCAADPESLPRCTW